jgi:Protein kinase domain
MAKYTGILSLQTVLNLVYATDVLVLYSLESDTWKIGDFGLTVEGTEDVPRTTVYSAGTECYRAPELLRGEKRTFTSKVDIWALGCIFFELLFRQTPFSSDWAAEHFSLIHHALDIPMREGDRIWNEISVEKVRECLGRMLHPEPDARPPATRIRIEFDAIPSRLFLSEESMSPSQDSRNQCERQDIGVQTEKGTADIGTQTENTTMAAGDGGANDGRGAEPYSIELANWNEKRRVWGLGHGNTINAGFDLVASYASHSNTEKGFSLLRELARLPSVRTWDNAFKYDMRKRIHELWLTLEVPRDDELMIENAYLVAIGSMEMEKWDEAGELLVEVNQYQCDLYDDYEHPRLLKTYRAMDRVQGHIMWRFQ